MNKKKKIRKIINKYEGNEKKVKEYYDELYSLGEFPIRDKLNLRNYLEREIEWLKLEHSTVATLPDKLTAMASICLATLIGVVTLRAAIYPKNAINLAVIVEIYGLLVLALVLLYTAYNFVSSSFRLRKARNYQLLVSALEKLEKEESQQSSEVNNRKEKMYSVTITERNAL